MAKASVLAALRSLDGISIRTDEPMQAHTPLRVGGPATIWAGVPSEETLQEVLQIAQKQRLKWKIHWPFENWLVKDNGFRGLIIRLVDNFEEAYLDHQNNIVAHSSVLWSRLPSLLPEFKEMQKWSGSIGGLFERNEENCLRGFPLEVHWVSATQKGTVTVSRRKKVMLPPNTVPVKIVFQGPRHQTGAVPTRIGTFFRLPKGEPLGVTLRDYGLCGIRLRNWKLSTHCPGLIVNLGKGNCRDALLLYKALRERVQKLHGTKWELSIPVIGSNRGKK